MKRDWYVFGIDQYGRRFNAAGGGFTQKGAADWATRFARADAKVLGFVKVLATNGAERQEFAVA